MSQEIINYPFDPELDDDDNESSQGFELSSETNTGYVNGHNLPDDDDEEDLILGDEEELDEADLAADEIDVEVDEDVDAVASDDDLVLDTADDVLDDEEEDL